MGKGRVGEVEIGPCEQATEGVRYEGCGRRMRMINYVNDYVGSLNNGMSSSVSERYQARDKLG